ncbi:MAG TPA: malectin domain-containing carbohydrate-binding protein [Chitinophagaceae bacterium]|nr:malectin domain-containing carbohydrate-binding protein [Chitinophagaceae bacterium]
MRRLIKNNFFGVASCITTIKLPLRRTLQGSVHYVAFFPQRSQRNSSIRGVKFIALLCLLMAPWFNSNAQRQDINLNNGWQTSLAGTNEWKKVNVPHNWDDYYGYRRLQHGNLHGDAVYKKSFVIRQSKQGKRFFLFFEGVGSYAKVILNSKPVGSHAGGRTTFTLDVTDAIKTDGTKNELEVEASHPANIKDLPWVCGGCSEERGFSEGSQPLGIFRPVHLIIANDICIEPFGVHAWSEDNNTSLFITTTCKNYSNKQRRIDIIQQLKSKEGSVLTTAYTHDRIQSLDISDVTQLIAIKSPTLWSIENPYLHEIVTTIKENDRIIDQVKTKFGFRTINWRTHSNQFYLNDKPVFINGIAEYEHLIGQSHAFNNEQIVARMKWIKAAGFNAFRDGHQPHNLLYGKLCNEKGILWWTQLSAHVWYDTKEFRENFKQLIKEWVIERRNDPSVILWGLQNESKLPEDFAKECTELIRSLDPTASSQRLVTTCNGGSGTDWDVPQNWTGTYGGDADTYAEDLKKQILVGEYGAWRTLDLHTEGGFVQNGILSEDRMTQLMEQKVRLAESVKDSIAGHFFWLLTSHDNPGRVQGGEGLRELDRIGPVNYKGLLTPWEEPTDAFYMYRSNYAPKEKEPMVYIVSHTWPNRWMKPGIKDSIYVYSNCDEVELFNDIDNASLGKRKRNGIGTHFQWDKVNIQYNVLYAVGYVNGKAVARDTLVLLHLPQSPNFNKLYAGAIDLTKPQPGYKYIYRINCGGPDDIDKNGNKWYADHDKDEQPLLASKQPLSWTSSSWAKDFPDIPKFFASQRRTFSPIKRTRDWKLFQTFRYGKDRLKYEFELPDGEYLVELYFVEPWIGVGGGINAKGMRLFDVAINDRIVLDDLDIWSEVGTNAALKKSVKVNITGGKMIISFPETNAGEALISAIAIASKKELYREAAIVTPGSPAVDITLQSWLDIGDKQYADEKIKFNSIPSVLFGADWIQFITKQVKRSVTFQPGKESYIYVALKNDDETAKDFENMNAEIITDENGGTAYKVYRKFCQADSIMVIPYGAEAIIAIQRASKMQPAYDLKPIRQYKANVVKLIDGVVKDSVNGRYSAIVNTNNNVVVDYAIQTGVADIYSITMKYFYPKPTPVKGKLQVIGAGNTMMLDEEVQFNFTNTGKWNQFTINTGNMINAGNYSVRLIITGAEGLAISGIDLQ